jgi:hypothetical protein
MIALINRFDFDRLTEVHGGRLLHIYDRCIRDGNLIQYYTGFVIMKQNLAHLDAISHILRLEHDFQNSLYPLITTRNRICR